LAGNPKVPSFDDHVAKNQLRPHAQCWTCELDPALRAEMHKAWAMGYRAAAIVRYLQEECGIEDIPIHGIQNHFNRRHHERP